MDTTTRILERAASELPGATATLLEAELHALVSDFCRQTRAWRYWLTDLSTPADSPGVLDLREYSYPGRVLGIIDAVWVGPWPVYPVADSQAPQKLRERVGTPLAYQTTPPRFSEIVFLPTPPQALSGIRVEVFLGPVPGDCSQLPDELYADIEEALVDGLVGRMTMKPKKPYSDAKLGAVRLSAYRAGCRRARVQASKSRTTAPSPWHYPMFA